ncbi:hypothetical protein KEM60_00886 [Austwickia sp. TVS 96-490-7B]|uniref:hypothetical protein n=1 Tax=Austwickia sp. TVS 96-490-7B TaxID=2830843 RepID=UPI001C575044|nr:hypothetical protein [Austwickia sp. TVS 96-490-7B]MBW3084697.1 hypothetical protein [Austwickia sp. TVS 96-490-7B]
MADIDLDPLLRAVAQDAARRAQLPEAAQVRLAGEHRRRGRAIAAGLAVTVVTVGAFTTMTRGGFGMVPASSNPDVATGVATPTPTAPSTPSTVAPSRTVGPEVPPWGGPSSVTNPTSPSRSRASTTTTAPSGIPSTGPGGSSGTGGPSVTGTPGTGSPSPSNSSPGSSNPAGTPPADGPKTDPKPGTGTQNSPQPNAGSPAAAALARGYSLRLSQPVNGSIGHRTLSHSGVASTAEGTLPYSAKVATTALLTGTAEGDTTGSSPSVAAVGVDTSGKARLSYFTAGRTDTTISLADADWSDLVSVDAFWDRSSRRVTVIGFHTDGRVSWQTVEAAWPGATPVVNPRRVLHTGLTGISASAVARTVSDAKGAFSQAWLYVAQGDQLVLVKVDEQQIRAEKVLSPRGLAGCTALALLTPTTSGIAGVAAWFGSGPGVLYAGNDPWGPMSYIGPTVPLPV